MLLELALFFPIGVLTNSWLPLPFEPVLLAFAASQPAETVWVFAALGSVCAMVGETIDVKLLGALQGKPPRRRFTRWLANTGRRFYVIAALIAVSPIPITMMRVAAYWRRPRPWLYGVSVGLGRLPRYLGILWVARHMGILAGI